MSFQSNCVCLSAVCHGEVAVRGWPPVSPQTLTQQQHWFAEADGGMYVESELQIIVWIGFSLLKHRGKKSVFSLCYGVSVVPPLSSISILLGSFAKVY